MDAGQVQGILRAELELFRGSLMEELLEALKQDLQARGGNLREASKVKVGLAGQVASSSTASQLATDGWSVAGSRRDGYKSLSPREDNVRNMEMVYGDENNHRKRLMCSIRQDVIMKTRKEQMPDNTCSCAAILASPWFHYVVSFAVVINAIMAGFEADWSIRHLRRERRAIFHIMDACFCAIFTAEFSVRLWVLRSNVFSGPDAGWNLLDLGFIVLQMVELSTLSIAKFKYLRILRLGRVLRVLRMGRTASTFVLSSELRMLLVTLISSLRSLLWLLVALLLTTYTMGVYITQLLADHWAQHPEQFDDSELKDYYGSLPLSMLTLYETLANGMSWRDALQPLMLEISVWLAIPFVLFTAFVMFALLNVVSGLFLNAAMLTAEDDKQRTVLKQIRRIFENVDRDGSGSITETDLKAELEKPEIEMYLKAMDIDVHNAHELFMLLDEGKDGQVDVQEFVTGCRRLQGAAKAIDFAVFRAEWHDMMQEQLQERSFLYQAVTENRKVVQENREALKENKDLLIALNKEVDQSKQGRS